MIYTTKLWDKLLGKVERYLPRRYSSLPQRLAVYTHPWTVTMGVDRYSNLTPFFFPGGVNGLPPYVMMDFDKAPTKYKLRMEGDTTIDRSKPVRVYLDDGPTLPLFWRNFDPNNPNEKDVKPPPFQKSGNSIIQATDIVIQTRRISVNLSVTKEVTEDFTGIQISPTYSQPPDYGFRITSVAKYVPPKSFLSTDDIASGLFFDNPVEECKICTIFALRQYGETTTPDPTWLFATTYDAYWNLLFFAPFVPDQNIGNRVTFASPLAGGALQAAVILGQLFANNNEYSEAFINFLSRIRTRGTFHAI